MIDQALTALEYQTEGTLPCEFVDLPGVDELAGHQ